MFEKQKTTRRQFLIQSLFGAAAVAVPLKLARSQPLGVIGANDRVRLGIIGLGSPGCRQIEILSGLRNVEIAAICDSDADRTGLMASFVSKSGRVPPIVSSEPRRIFDLRDVDAICVAVPWAERANFAFMSLESEKDIFIDAPFCGSLDESRRIMNLSKKANRVVAINENYGLRTPWPFAERNRIFEENFISAAGRMELGGGENPKKSRRYIPEQSYGLLDAGRAILGAGMPSAISTYEVEGISRKSVEFEFKSEAGDKKNFIFEMNAGGPSRPNAFNSGESRLSSLEFLSSRGTFEIYADSTLQRAIDEASLSRFISFVRTRPMTEVLANLAEARKSAAMLHLANISSRLQKNIHFDSATEKARDHDGTAVDVEIKTLSEPAG